MHARNYIGREKKRQYQLKLIWWWYNFILGCTGRIWLNGEYLKSSSDALSVQGIGCISTLDMQENVRILKKLLRTDLSI